MRSKLLTVWKGILHPDKGFPKRVGMFYNNVSIDNAKNVKEQLV